MPDESVVGKLCIVGEAETPTGKLCITGSIASIPDPTGRLCIISLVHQFDHIGKITIVGEVHQSSVDGKICIKGQVHQSSVDGKICIVSVVRELAETVGPHPIGSSTPTGVLPQTGSAVFPRWEQVTAKEILIHRHWDFHESGRLNFDDNRKAWRLEMNVAGDKQIEVAAFFVSHVWAGKSFYFYDTQTAGVVYDPAGVLTNGRYKVRFVGEDFPRVQNVGPRFTIPISIIEVD